MVTFTTIPIAEAPPPPQTGGAGAGDATRLLLTEYVASIGKGEVGSFELEDGDNPRGTKMRIHAAARRAGRKVKIWESGGILYVAVEGQ